MAEQALGRQQGRVLGQVLAVHDQVLPVHVDLDVVESLLAQLADHEQAHPDVAHQDLHRRLGVLVLEEQLDPVLAAHRGCLAQPLDQPAPRVDVRRLEWVVVALAARPDDQVGAERSGERRRVADDPDGLGAQRRIGVDQPSAAEARIEVQTAGDGSRCRDRSRARRAPRPGSQVRARSGSGTRSRRSDRRGPRPRGVPSRRPARARSRAAAGSRPGTNRVTIGPKAQIPKLVFITAPSSRGVRARSYSGGRVSANMPRLSRKRGGAAGATNGLR